MKRIHVIGTTGSGKTTLAANIANRLNIPHVELDALHWEPGWQPAQPDVFRWRVAKALEGNTWTVDGNYSKVRDIVWARADTIIWLDYSLAVIFWQLTKRTFTRVFTQEELWQGNKERFTDQFLNKNSLFLWALKTYKRRRQEYPQLLTLPEFSHFMVIRHKSPTITKTWLAQLTVTANYPLNSVT